MKEKTPTSIFYVDDDVDDLDFFNEVATEINEPVSLFEEGDKLLQQLQNPPPFASVIFLDLNMPVKSGFDVLREIKATMAISHIPVFILTTSINPDDIKLTKKLGANLYIPKPTTIGGLKKAVKHVLSIDWNKFEISENEFVYTETKKTV
ncbi:response regulator [Flavobacterium sp.]|uniref:response regulator n=1 Tax=Flavobacterium sp. TaxID=239 RepID=UPI0025F65828|nr:response regulator [Flavobacterium sp.]